MLRRKASRFWGSFTPAKISIGNLIWSDGRRLDEEQIEELQEEEARVSHSHRLLFSLFPRRFLWFHSSFSGVETRWSFTLWSLDSIGGLFSSVLWLIKGFMIGIRMYLVLNPGWECWRWWRVGKKILARCLMVLLEKNLLDRFLFRSDFVANLDF